MRVLWWAAICTLFANFLLLTSWAGHRPLQPNPETGQVFAFSNHGIMYVSREDLIATHGLLGLAAILFLAAIVCGLLDERRLKSLSRQRGA